MKSIMLKTICFVVLVSFTSASAMTEDENLSKEVERAMTPRFDEGTKLLVKNFPWIYNAMHDIVNSPIHYSSQISGLVEVKVVADLNGDSIDELYIEDAGMCGASICHYPVYHINVKSKTLDKIFDEYGTEESNHIGLKTLNGWKSITVTSCYGTADCVEYSYVYDERKKCYVQHDEAL